MKGLFFIFSLFFILLGVLFGFFAWSRNKEKEREKQIKNLSPDFFNEKRAKMLPKDYIKWLREFYTSIGVEALECRDDGRRTKLHLFNALILTEKEIEDVNAKMGTQINLDKRISHEFRP